MANTAPFPAPNGPNSTPNPLNNGSAENILRTNRDAGALAQQSLDDIWDNLISANGVFYQSLITGLRPLVVLGFFVWAGGAVYQWHTKYQRKSFPFGQLSVPLLVIIAFTNNGQYLEQATQIGRFSIYEVNDSILDATINGIKGRVAIQNVANEQAAIEALSTARAICANEDTEEAEQACLDQALSNISSLANSAGNTSQPEPGFFDGFGFAIGFSVQAAVTTAIVGLLNGVSVIMHFAFGFLLVMWASTGPFWVAVHMLPFGKRGIQIFVSGFVAGGVSIILYTSLTVASAAYLAEAARGDQLIYPLVTGLVNPVFAILGGAGGFAGAFSGVSQVAVLVSRGLVRR